MALPSKGLEGLSPALSPLQDGQQTTTGAQMEKQVKGTFQKKITNYELNVGTKLVRVQRPVRKSRKSERKEN
ncbi:MAG: hypothetical protein Q9226_006687 [Calogaya cf. arnoldii]